MARQKEFIPLPEVNGSTARIGVNLSLPLGVDSKTIGFDLERLKNFMDTGGIKNLKISGIDAIHTKKKAITGFEIQTQVRREKSLLSDTYVDGIIQVNMQPKSRRNLDSSYDWASHIDKGLRTGITAIATKYLLFGASSEEKKEHIISDVLTGTTISGGFVVDSKWGLLILGVNVAGRVMGNIAGHVFPLSDYYRSSFFSRISNRSGSGTCSKSQNTKVSTRTSDKKKLIL